MYLKFRSNLPCCPPNSPPDWPHVIGCTHNHGATIPDYSSAKTKFQISHALRHAMGGYHELCGPHSRPFSFPISLSFIYPPYLCINILLASLSRLIVRFGVHDKEAKNPFCKIWVFVSEFDSIQRIIFLTKASLTPSSSSSPSLQRVHVSQLQTFPKSCFLLLLMFFYE